MLYDPDKILKSYLDSSRIPHALILVSHDQESLLVSALDFCCSYFSKEDPKFVSSKDCLNCIDCQLFGPTTKSLQYSIEQVKEICAQSQLQPHSHSKQFFVLKQAHQMKDAAANALLKTLEEPNLRSVFILLTSQLEAILPTVASRAQKIHFNQVKEEEDSLPSKLLLELLSRFDQISYNDVFQVMQEIQSELEKDKEQKYDQIQEAQKFLIQIQKWFHNDYLTKKPENVAIKELKALEFEKALVQSKTAIDRSMKLSLLLENMFVNLKLIDQMKF